VVAWLRSSAARTRLRAVCVGRSRLPLVSLSPIHAADSVGHTADVRNRTCAFFCCPENPEHLARDYRPFIRKPAIFLGSCARRIPLLTRFPACSQPDRTAQSVPYPAAGNRRRPTRPSIARPLQSFGRSRCMDRVSVLAKIRSSNLHCAFRTF